MCSSVALRTLTVLCKHCLTSGVCAQLVPNSDPMDVTHQAPLSMGFFQARVLEWVAISSSRYLPDPGVDGEGNGTPLQYSCLENPMDGGAWWAAVHGVAKSRTRLNDFTFTFHFHALEKEMATHSSVLAWRIPGTGEPGGLQSMGSHRVWHDWNDLAAAAAGVESLSLALQMSSLPLSHLGSPCITISTIHF